MELTLEEAVFGKSVEIKLPNNGKKVEVNIPPGVDIGNKIRLSGEGEQSQYGGESGDLYIVINLKKHSFFEREGNNLYCEVPLRLDQALVGDDIEIPTLTKKILLKIPPETQTGKVFKIKDKGAGSLHGRTQGDLFVRVVVETPTNLSSKDKKEMINIFSNIKENYPEHKSYLDQLNKKFDD